MGPFAEAPGPAESHPSSASAATMANSTSSVNATAPMNTTISDSFEDHVEGGLEFKAKRALVGAISGAIVVSLLHFGDIVRRNSEWKVPSEYIFFQYVVCVFFSTR